jgi:thioredoxin-related protein
MAAAGAGFVLLATWKIAPRVYNDQRRRALAGRRIYDEGADTAALLQTALDRAGREHKRVLAILGGNWCQWCLALDDLMTTDEEIRTFVAEKLVVVHLDSEAAARLDDAWGSPTRLGVPTLVFLDPTGAVVHVQGSIPLEAFGGRVLKHDRVKVLAALRASA